MASTETDPRAVEKDPAFVAHQAAPYNGEPPLDRLADSFITPTPLFFVRNHAPVPDLDPERHQLRVGGLVETEGAWSLERLRRGFEVVEATVTLQCAGNRRQELMDIREIPGEVAWACAAVGTAVWRGVRLRDVLQAAGLESGARHVELVGADRIEKEGHTTGFGGSIPVETALDPSVLLAWEMNGEPLPPAHGAPLRAVVPGYIGARSVKWLEQIRVLDAPSENFYQARSYKLFPPETTAGTADWSAAPSLGELALNAVVTAPAEGARVSPTESDGLEVRGYAIAGGDRRVERVEVSIDGGRNWTEARLHGPEGAEAEGPEAPSSGAAWVLWAASFDPSDLDRVASEGPTTEIVARTFDSQGNGQPARVEPLWNFKGYMNNAWHRVRVTLE